MEPAGPEQIRTRNRRLQSRRIGVPHAHLLQPRLRKPEAPFRQNEPVLCVVPRKRPV